MQKREIFQISDTMAVTFLIILPVYLTHITTIEFITYKTIHICNPQIVKQWNEKENYMLTR